MNATPTATQQLVHDNLSLVYAVAVRVFRSIRKAVELDELISLGTEGLIQAAQRFDPDEGATFRTFAYYRVRGAIYDGISDVAPLPRSVYRKRRAALQMQEHLEQRARIEGETVLQSAASLYDSLSGAAAIFVTSWDALDDGDGPTANDAAADPHELLALAQLRARLGGAMERLPKRERHLLRRHYYDDLTLLEAGRELGISKSWACRVHARAIEMLRNQLQAM